MTEDDNECDAEIVYLFKHTLIHTISLPQTHTHHARHTLDGNETADKCTLTTLN